MSPFDNHGVELIFEPNKRSRPVILVPIEFSSADFGTNRWFEIDSLSKIIAVRRLSIELIAIFLSKTMFLLCSNI